MPTAEATREVVLRLPESLAHDAECAGLLTPAAIGNLVRRELIDRELSAPFPDASPGEPSNLYDVAALVREVRSEMRAVASSAR